MPLTMKLHRALIRMEQWDYSMHSTLRSCGYDIADIPSDCWQEAYLRLRRELGGKGLGTMHEGNRERLRRLADDMILMVERAPIRTLTPECINSFRRSEAMAREILAELDGGDGPCR